MSLLKETKKEGLRSPADVMKDLMGDKYTPFWDLDFWAQLGPDPTGAPHLGRHLVDFLGQHSSFKLAGHVGPMDRYVLLCLLNPKSWKL